MTRTALQEYAAVMRQRYLGASRRQKTMLLDELVQVTGHHRKAAIRLLRRTPAPPGRRRGRPRQYGAAVTAALREVWEVADRIAARRLHPFLGKLVTQLEQHGELRLAPAVRTALLTMSPATLERRLAEIRRHLPSRRHRTKPGTLLRGQVPVHTAADWDDARPGWLEIDLVEHNGGSTQGTYCYSLNTVDVATGWVEVVAQPNRSQQATLASIQQVRRQVPVPLRGLDCDNGSEFLNNHLLRYCTAAQITLTRSRPLKKNDQAHIEQKNWTVVRRFVGYPRYSGPGACAALNALYQRVRLYVNFFQPGVQLVAKARDGAKVRKRYDQAQTPYERLVAAGCLTDAPAVALAAQYATLNPKALLAEIRQLQHRLGALAEASG